MSRPLLSAEDVAQLLGISRRTVYRFIASGDLAAVQVGRQRKVQPEAIESYLRKHQVQPAQKTPEPTLKGTRYHEPVELGGDRYVQ